MFGDERYHHRDFPSNFPREKTLIQKMSKAGLINSLGWSMEYMITHMGLIVANPELYRKMGEFTAQYGISALGLIGRGTIWIGRGLFIVAAGETSPDGIIRKGLIDLMSVSAVSMLYVAACESTGHRGMLIEKTFVDTVVASALSSLIEPCCPRPSISWQFWRREREEEDIPLVTGLSSQRQRGYGMNMRWGDD